MAVTSYSRIKTYADDYCRGTSTTETLAILMPIADVLALIERGGTEATQLMAVLSKDGGTPSLTVSLLCADDNDNILDDHKNGTIDGEETWGTKKIVADFNDLFS